MSGLGVKPWSVVQWQAYCAALDVAGYYVDHCSHCDRSNRHPSCVILPLPGREQGPCPKPDEPRFQAVASRMQPVSEASCWRCGVSFCVLFTKPGLFETLYPQDVTQAIPYLKCDGCGQLSVRVSAECTVIEVGG